MARGGKREGAGRPKVENPMKSYTFRLKIEEVEKVKEFIKRLRFK